MLRSPCVPYGNRCLQHLDYVSISDSQLRRRGFKRTEHFERERFQIVNGKPPNIYRIRSGIEKRVYGFPPQPPAALLPFLPEANRARRGKNPRTLGKQFQRVGYFVPDEIHAQISRNPMHVNEANIHVLAAADGLPSPRQPLLRDVPTEKNMQMGIPVLLKFQHADEIKTLAAAAVLPRQQDAHPSPQIAD